MKKTVLVTGASRGIGKAIALKFAKEGYHVIINCIKNKVQLLDTKREIESFGVSCIAYVGNIGEEKCALEMFSLIQNEFDSLDVVINNAGISYIGLLTDMSMDDWTSMIQSNLNSVFLCSKLAIPGMVHNKSGRIINISSVWGVVGASCEVAYSTTKGAINSFTMALAKELAPSNIQVNAIACGAIDTQMNHFLEAEERYELIQEIPSERFGETSEVADFVYQIASASTYLTGQVIKFDGGWI